MDRNLIHNLTGQSIPFIDEWLDDNDYIIAHTSGSTGKPKDIRLSKADMIASAKATNEFFGINESSNLLLPLSPDYIAGKMMIVRALVANANLYAINPSRDFRTIQLPVAEFDLVAIVPAQCTGLVEMSNLIRFKNIIVGGGKLFPDDLQIIKQVNSNVYATYGMTETCSHVALKNIRDEQPTFHALPNFTFALDHRGCLAIDNPNVGFCPIVTNDLVEIISPTEFRWLGRFDNVINTGGIKVSPEELEERIKSLTPDLSFIISSKPSKEWGEEIVMIIESASECDDGKILNSLRQHLPHHLAPKSIIHIESFDRTDSGKIIRKNYQTNN